MTGPSLDQELLAAAERLEAFTAADPHRPGMVELPLVEANRIAALLRTGADVVEVAVNYQAGPGPGQERLDLAADLQSHGASYDQVRGHIDDSGI